MEEGFVMIYNTNTDQDNTHGIKLTNEMIYLGVNFTNKRYASKILKPLS